MTDTTTTKICDSGKWQNRDGSTIEEEIDPHWQDRTKLLTTSHAFHWALPVHDARPRQIEEALGRPAPPNNFRTHEQLLEAGLRISGGRDWAAKSKSATLGRESKSGRANSLQEEELQAGAKWGETSPSGTTIQGTRKQKQQNQSRNQICTAWVLMAQKENRTCVPQLKRLISAEENETKEERAHAAGLKHAVGKLNLTHGNLCGMKTEAWMNNLERENSINVRLEGSRGKNSVHGNQAEKNDS
jgi:hypothetical protein